MQRSIFNKNYFVTLLFLCSFIIYESMTTLYFFFPPLLAVLYSMLSENIETEHYFSIFIILFMLLFFEVSNGYFFMSSLIYFLILHYIVVPKLHQYVECKACFKLLFSIVSYIGFYFFILLTAQIFLLDFPAIGIYILYFIVIEFILMSLL
jgi:hypothetical protein